MDTAKTMGRVSRPETLENHEFSKSVFFLDFFGGPKSLRTKLLEGPRD